MQLSKNQILFITIAFISVVLGVFAHQFLPDKYYYAKNEVIDGAFISKRLMDNYKIKGQSGDLKFITKGKWDIDTIQFKIISVHGGYLNINKKGSNIYHFELEDFKVKFIYKRSLILGKISINEKIHFYLKKYKRSINFYDEFNNRVSNGTFFKSEVQNDNIIYFYKLIFDSSHSQYKQIFLTVYLLYLQIVKNVLQCF